MISFAAMALLGFLFGMRHALDPDHVIAVTTIVSTERSMARAGLIGSLWGLGHTATIFVVGSAIIIFNIAIPPRLGLSMEFAVGAMLILLGVLTLSGTVQMIQQRFAAQAPTPDASGDGSGAGPNCLAPRGEAGIHKRAGGLLRGFGFYNSLRPVLIGIVHGLAGSAAVALLVMTTIRDPWISIAYLLLFGFGTIAGMVLITVVISAPFIHTAHRYSRLNRGITVASGLISLGFGLFVSLRIGFVQNLFGSHPQWTPR